MEREKREKKSEKWKGDIGINCGIKKEGVKREKLMLRERKRRIG